MVVVLMGVSGSGKTTVGRLLADDLGWPFHDGDDFHPRDNVDKMRRGAPLTDEDRAAWLDRLRALIEELVRDHRCAVLACSALKHAYRVRLNVDPTEIRFVHLRGDYELIRKRLDQRKSHFMPPALLRSQYEALEEPRDAIAVDAAEPPESVVRRIVEGLQLRDRSRS